MDGTPANLTPGPAGTAPLTAGRWVLREIVREGRAEPASAEVTFRFDGQSASDSSGNSARAAVTGRHITFGHWINGLVSYAFGPCLTVDQMLATCSILTGRTSWDVRSGQLTIVGGQGKMRFSAAP